MYCELEESYWNNDSVVLWSSNLFCLLSYNKMWKNLGTVRGEEIHLTVKTYSVYKQKLFEFWWVQNQHIHVEVCFKHLYSSYDVRSDHFTFILTSDILRLLNLLPCLYTDTLFTELEICKQMTCECLQLWFHECLWHWLMEYKNFNWQLSVVSGMPTLHRQYFGSWPFPSWGSGTTVESSLLYPLHHANVSLELGWRFVLSNGPNTMGFMGLLPDNTTTTLFRALSVPHTLDNVQPKICIIYPEHTFIDIPSSNDVLISNVKGPITQISPLKDETDCLQMNSKIF